ncbi:MAG TPA: tRNA pseudouridine(38-40) synthase TruA [Anaerolineaceae bacterium]|nr:tRNA pseudouridine(38-40) synthase TruA [Anaerolineaceae bacterium]
MALYQLILAYDGTDFSGFQRQGNARTVQGTLESVLRELGWSEGAILFAGRTDAGVHASGQVVTFTLDWQHSSANLVSALNARLPSDVSVLKVEKAKAEFHPRYDASSRTYRYSIYHSAVRHPLCDRYAWRLWPELDVNRLQEITTIFHGRHDFSAFGRAMKPGNSTVREVKTSRWFMEGQYLLYEVEANAFLYHMVRRLVYCQVQAARGRISLEELVEGLETGRKVHPGLAPSCGLALVNVAYDGSRRGEVEKDENLD